MSETVIFLSSGIFISRFYTQAKDVFDLSHILSAIIFFLVTVAARFVSILIFKPILSNTGYGLNWKEYIVLSFVGFKGSHGLFLSLVVSSGPYPTIVRKTCLFYTAECVYYSLIFQAFWTKDLLKALHMVHHKPEKKQLTIQFQKQSLLHFYSIKE